MKFLEDRYGYHTLSKASFGSMLMGILLIVIIVYTGETYTCGEKNPDCHDDVAQVQIKFITISSFFVLGGLVSWIVIRTRQGYKNELEYAKKHGEEDYL